MFEPYLLAWPRGDGVIDMELLSVIRRWHYRDRFSIREISRRTGLSGNTVRKYLRSDSVEPKFAVPDRPSRLDPYADKLSHMLRQEAGKSRKQKRTIKQLHADLYQRPRWLTHAGDSRIAAGLIQVGAGDSRHAISGQIARGLFG